MKLRTQFSLAFVPILLISGASLMGLARRAIHRVIFDEVTRAGQARLEEVAAQSAPDFLAGSERKLLPSLTSAMNQAGASYAIAFDDKGRVLAHTNVVEKGKRYIDPLTRAALQSDRPLVREYTGPKGRFLDLSQPVWGSAHRESAEEMFLSQAQPMEKPVRLGTLRLGISLAPAAATESRISRQLAVLLLCTGAILLGLALLLVRSLLTPIDGLARATEQIASGVYGKTLPIPSAKELADLAESFNRMNQALAQTTVSKEFLDSILLHMLEPLIVLHPDYRIRMINRAALDILGYDPGELLGQSVDGFWDAAAPLLKQIVESGSLKAQELQFRSKKGEPIAVLLSGSTFLDKHGHLLGLILVANDIRERKRLEREMSQADKLSAVGRLASGVAHEINNPLAVILGFAQTVLWDIKPDDPLEFPIRSIERETIRCKNLVQELLTFSRVSKTEREPMDLNKAIEGAFALVQAQARVGRVTVVKELAPDLPHILGNVNQMQQIVINLANNALDAMQQKGTLTVRTAVVSEGSLSWVILSMIDTGPGIPEDVLPRIFEPFFTTKPIGQGTGLGLGLVHEIIQKHSGTIEVETRPGHTEFRVKLPAPGTRRPAGSSSF